jgi:hypothetical protein
MHKLVDPAPGVCSHGHHLSPLGSAPATPQGKVHSAEHLEKVLEWEARPRLWELGQKGEGQGRGKRGPSHAFDGISKTSLALTKPELRRACTLSIENL